MKNNLLIVLVGTFFVACGQINTTVDELQTSSSSGEQYSSVAETSSSEGVSSSPNSSSTTVSSSAKNSSGNISSSINSSSTNTSLSEILNSSATSSSSSPVSSSFNLSSSSSISSSTALSSRSTPSSSSMFSGFPALVQDGALTKAEALELTTNSTLILVGDKQAAQPLFSSINLSGGVSNKTVNNILISAGNNADQVVFLSATQYSGGTFVTGFLKEADVFTGVFSTLDNNGSFVGPIWTTSPSWGYPEYQAVDGDVTPGGLACIATNGINGSSVDGLIIRLKPLADLNVGEDPMLKLITQSNTTYTAAIAQSDESCIGVGWQNLGAGQFGLALMKMSATGTKSWFISHSPGSLGGTDARLIDIAMNGSTLAGLVEVDGNIMLVVIDPSSGSISQKSGSLAMGTAKFIETSADGNYFIGGQAAGKALVQKISASNFSVLWNTLLATSGSIAIDLAEASNGALYIAGTEGSDSWIRLLNSNGVEQ